MQTNYLKIVWIAAFAVFACVSCWATAESLHLLLSSWPAIFCWIVAIGFFIIASIGTKMIVDSLNTEIHLDNRGLRLIGGIVLIVIFWLLFSMPTNTHTFFYRTAIDGMVTSDIGTTRGYLSQIEYNSKMKVQANLKIQKLESDVKNELAGLQNEIVNKGNPGDGQQCRQYHQRLETLLGMQQPLSFSGNPKNLKQLQDRFEMYKSAYLNILDQRKAEIVSNILSPNETSLKQARLADENLRLTKEYIEQKVINLNKAEDITGVCDKLNDGYNAIKINKDFVNFDNETDEATYTAQTPVTKVKRMISVFDVWKDYLNGGFRGHGFIIWIILSILVDTAAFIFFDMAFKKNEY